MTTVSATASAKAASSTSQNITLTGSSAGDRITLGIGQSSSFIRTYTPTSPGDTWSIVTTNDKNGRVAEVWSATASAANTVITVAASAAANYGIGAVASPDVSATAEDTSIYDCPNSNPMYAADTTGFDATEDAIILGVLAANATLAGSTFDSDYTVVLDSPTTTAVCAIGYRIVGAGGLTDERMTWQGVTTTRVGPGVSASFPAGVAPPAATASQLTLLGVG